MIKTVCQLRNFTWNFVRRLMSPSIVVHCVSNRTIAMPFVSYWTCFNSSMAWSNFCNTNVSNLSECVTPTPMYALRWQMNALEGNVSGFNHTHAMIRIGSIARSEAVDFMLDGVQWNKNLWHCSKYSHCSRLGMLWWWVLENVFWYLWSEFQSISSEDNEFKTEIPKYYIINIQHLFNLYRFVR